jgi:hypothetical protein
MLLFCHSFISIHSSRNLYSLYLMNIFISLILSSILSPIVFYNLSNHYNDFHQIHNLFQLSYQTTISTYSPLLKSHFEAINSNIQVILLLD